MARLLYSATMSLDGFVADRDGSFDWAEPDEEVTWSTACGVSVLLSDLPSYT